MPGSKKSRGVEASTQLCTCEPRSKNVLVPSKSSMYAMPRSVPVLIWLGKPGRSCANSARSATSDGALVL